MLEIQDGEDGEDEMSSSLRQNEVGLSTRDRKRRCINVRAESEEGWTKCFHMDSQQSTVATTTT